MRTAEHNRVDLIEAYYTRVLGVAYQVVGDATLAARAARTIFRRVRRLRPTADQAPVKLWRMTLKILRGYRARGLAVTPLVAASADWQTALLNRMAGLEPDQRILLLLRYREGLDDQQLAEVLQVNRQTVRARLAQARNRLLAEQSSMRCTEIEELIADYVDGVADERGRRIAERHIQRCEPCHERLQRTRQLAQQLRRLTLLPAGIQDRVPRLRSELERRLNRRLPFFR